MGPSELFLDRPIVGWSLGLLLELLSSGSSLSLGKLLELVSSCSALGLMSTYDGGLSYGVHCYLRSSSDCFNSSSIDVAGDTPGAFYDSFMFACLRYKLKLLLNLVSCT